jgi:hypothetical protein
MKMHKVMASSCAAVLVCCGTVSAEVVFDADFQGSASGASNLLIATELDRETILNNGTSTGSWDDNGVNPLRAYEIAEDEAGNKVMLFSHHDSGLKMGEAYFDSVASLSGGELSVDWEWMYNCVGNNSQIWFELLDSTTSVVASVKWDKTGVLSLDGNVKDTLVSFLAYNATLSTNNWNPLAMNITLTATDITLSAGTNAYASVAGAYADVIGIRLRMTSNRPARPSGWWIDNIRAETFVAGGATFALDPAVQLDIPLTAPATTAVGGVDASFVFGPGSNNVFISSIAISNELVSGSFSSLHPGPFPIELTDPAPSNETLSIQFDNGVAGLLHNGSATGTVVVSWYEAGGATNTREVSVVATYDNTPVSLILNPSDTLSLVSIDPATASTGSVAVSYTEQTAYPTNVTIVGVDITDTNHAVFSSTTILPIELSDPDPSNDTLTIVFDSSGFSDGQTATGNVVVSWVEAGASITNQNILPLIGIHHELEPVTGTFSVHENQPTNNIVLASSASFDAQVNVKRIGLHSDVNPSGYSKVGQEIKGSSLTSGSASFDTLCLKMRQSTILTGSSGANQLNVWMGKIDETTGATIETLANEVFDCSGSEFKKNKYVKFQLGAPVDFEPADLGANESYAFQLWWTADDADNQMLFWRSDGSSAVDGGHYSEVDLAYSNTSFPIAMTNRLEDQDLYFLLINNAAPTDIGDVTIEYDGSNLIMGWIGVSGESYAVQRKEDLVEDLVWSNIVTGITGVGPISVTNDTTDPQAFYRTVLE